MTNYVKSDPTNLSSHNVVILEFEYHVETDRHAYVDETEEKHCKWSKATADDICKYRHVLDCILEHMVVPTDMLRCGNVQCKNRAHSESIDKMCSDIIKKGKGMVLYSAVSSPLDRSKRFTLSSPGRPVHSDTVLGFSWKHSSHAAIAQRLFTHISTTVYSQVLIYTAESTEAS